MWLFWKGHNSQCITQYYSDFFCIGAVFETLKGKWHSSWNRYLPKIKSQMSVLLRQYRVLKELLGECNSSTYILSAEGVSDLLLSLVMLYFHWLIPAIRGVEILLTLSYLVSEASNETENVIISILLNSHENIEIPYSQLFCGSKFSHLCSKCYQQNFQWFFWISFLWYCPSHVHICVGEKQLKVITYFTIESMIRG